MSDLSIRSGQPVGGADSQPKEALAISSAKTVEEAKDTLSPSSLELQQSKEAASITAAPLLPKPKAKYPSLRDFLTSLGNAQLNFQRVTLDSLDANQKFKLQQSDALVAQSLAVIDTQKRIDQAIQEIEKQTAALIEQIQGMFAEVDELIKMQNELIKQLEAGNQEEKAQFAELSAAYKTYTDGLKALGAKDDGNGNYTIPKDKKEEAEKLAADYQAAVDKFNTYWEGRLAQINAYNQSAQAYNAKAAEMNQSLNRLIDEYGLQMNKDPVPSVKLRDTTGYSTSIPGPTKNSEKSYSLSPLPSFVKSIAKNGPNTIPPLSFNPPNPTSFYDAIYSKLYNDQVAPLNDELLQDLTYLAYLNLRACQPMIDGIPHPILNRKPLAQLLLPESAITYRPGTKSVEANPFWKNQGPEAQSEKLLAKETIKEILAESSQNEEEINRKAEQLMFLSVEQLSRLSRNALLQSAQQSGSLLASLPKDSPVFSILFSLALVKNIQDSAQNGWTSREVEAFTAQNPDFQLLSPDQRQSLAAAISTGQLLIAGKLLEANIGLPELFSNLLLAQVSPEHALALRTQTAAENLQAQSELQDQLASHFKNNGFSEEKAAFLAKMGADGVFNGTWSAPPLAVVSTTNINLPLFTDSLAASLILAQPNLTLTDALLIAQKAAQSTLVSGPFHSTDQLRRTLENKLAELGQKESSQLIAAQAILLPKSAPASADWKTTLNNYLQPLLTPHLGKEQTRTLTDEIRAILETLPNQLKGDVNDLIRKTLPNHSGLHSLLSTLTNPALLFTQSISTETIQYNKELSI